MAASLIERDEQTMSVENASYRRHCSSCRSACCSGSRYRSFVLQQAAWDLRALVLVSGVIASGYQAASRALPANWLGRVLIAAAIAAVIAGGCGVVEVRVVERVARGMRGRTERSDLFCPPPPS